MSRRAIGLSGEVEVRKRSKWMKNLHHHAAIYLFLLPALGFFVVFSAYPIVYSLVMSFTDWPLLGNAHFVGFANYLKVLQDPVVATSFKNVLLYLIICVPLQLVLGLLVALGLDRPMRGRTTLRLLYYLPVITSWIVVTFMFQYMFNTQFGIVNWLLESLHLINQPISWLADPRKAIVVAAIIQIWKGIGWAMMIFLAGLQNVPENLYEASSIDGAGSWQKFWFITLPGIRGPFFFNSVLLVMGAFESFIQIFVLTAGGPANETQFPMVWMYEQAFSNLHFGYAGALSWLMTLLIIIISVIQFSIFRPRSLQL